MVENSNLIEWAQTQPSLRAIIAVGSQVRRDHPADEWSDRDFMMFVTDFAPYLDNTDWLAPLGTVWACLPFQPPGSEPERLVLFEGGQKVDFHFFPVSELDHMVQTQTLDEVYQRGYVILVDKDQRAAHLPPCPFATPTYLKPSLEEFHITAVRFWYSALQIARGIRRRDLWVVKISDCLMLKGDLLRMMEWHAHALHDWRNYDTWHNGRFLLEWTDDATRDALPQLFGGFDPQASWQAHRASLDLFRRLAMATAARLDYEYPHDLDHRLSQLIEQLYAGDQA